MAISLTDAAADRVRSYLEKRNAGLGLRLGVTKTGCSGYSYVINYAEEIDARRTSFSRTRASRSLSTPRLSH